MRTRVWPPIVIQTAAIWVLVLVGNAGAQVRIGMVIDHESVLPFEPVVVTVAIVNDANTPIVFGPENFNATFHVILSRGTRRTEDLPSEVTRAIDRRAVVLPGEGHRELIELGALFNLHEQRTYRVSVVIEHEGIRYRARDQVFDIVNGIELRSVVHPVPGYRDLKLTYSLRYWRRRQSEHLFLCVIDEQSGTSYGTFDIGPVLRFAPPSLRYDPAGWMTVVHQSGRERYTRSRFTVSGEGVDFVGQDHFLSDGAPYPQDRPMGIIRDPPRPVR